KEIHALQKQIEDDFHARNLTPEQAKDPKAPKALSDDELAAVKESLAKAREELAALQGETPLINVNVDSQAIAEVVANWTGIPVGKMVSNEIKAVLDLQNVMGEQVIGQPHALEAIAQSIRTSRAGLTDPSKPIGVFFMVGSSSVGKTETALALADILYGGEQNITVINMSAFTEEHEVTR